MNDSTCAATPSPRRRRPTLFGPRVLVPVALVSLYLVWGSTYLAIRVALESYPPFLMAGTRFLVRRRRAVCVPALARHGRRRRARNGSTPRSPARCCSAWATGSSATPSRASPRDSPRSRSPRCRCSPRCLAVYTANGRGAWNGSASRVGFAGVVLLNLGGGMAGAPLGAIALLIAAMSWAFGSVWSRRRDMPPAAMNTAAQMLTGGTVLFVGALLFGERFPADAVDGVDACARLSRGRWDRWSDSRRISICSTPCGRRSRRAMRM